MSDVTPGSLTKEIAAQDVPEDVFSWLGRLVLLYGAPFHYLIPEEDMLPKESIRFFYLDPIWIQCLVQGACSVGNTDYGDTLIDKAMNSLVQPADPPSPDKKPSAANKSAAGVRARLRQQYEGISLSEKGPAETESLAWPLMGFLMRSSAVKGWRGLEIIAYRTFLDEADKKKWASQPLNEDDKDKFDHGFAPLQALRIEQLSEDVMLGIFNGRIAQLVVRQPQEGLHFGLTRKDNSFIKTLRKLGFKGSAGKGEVSETNVIDLTAKGLIRKGSPQGVINVAGLAAQMKSQLGNELLEGKFTSAEFAVEMIEAAGQFTFIPKEPAPRA